MRAPIIGACLRADTERLVQFVRASTRLTHTDPRADEGARAVALAASYGARHVAGDIDREEFLRWLREHIEGEELVAALAKVEDHLARGSTPAALADELGLGKGVTGFVNHTVPIAIFCWLRSPDDFRRAVEDVILLGGDTDTTAAIVGGLAGATVGATRIPEEWVSGLVDWPRSVNWLRRLAAQLAREFSEPCSGGSSGPISLFWPAVVIRNIFFLVIVLLHGFRRLFPPY
jgi:ADP-ribosylglycohydrolase